MLTLMFVLVFAGALTAVGGHRIVPPSLVIEPSSARGCQSTVLLLAILAAVSFIWLQSP